METQVKQNRQQQYFKVYKQWNKITSSTSETAWKKWYHYTLQENAIFYVWEKSVMKILF